MMRPSPATVVFLLGTPVILLCAAATEARAMSAEAVANPRPAGGWVSDHADMLSLAEEQELNRMISAAESEFGAEIAVVTVQDVDTATPKDFATELFNLWGIGKADTNNGLLVLMVAGQRRLEMETGYGTETVLTDGWLKQMQERDMVPRFKEGRFGEGLTAGVRLSIERMREYELTGQLVDPSDSGGEPWWLFLLGGGGTLGGAVALRRARWKQERTCPDCKQMMTMLPEEQDDVHLSGGQRTEERIGSVNWEYWYCTQCKTHRLIGVGKFFSGYSRCPSCSHKTLSSSSSTLVSATEHSTGLAEVVTDCAHCSHHTRTTRVIPRVVPASSSSSSSSSYSGGGGSFGGGSSGGGGSGSSW